MSGQHGYVVVSTVQGQFVEAQIKAFLEAHDVPCQLRGESLRLTHAISIDGIGAAGQGDFISILAAIAGARDDGIGAAEVLVPAELADKARDLLARAERGELAIDEVPSERYTDE